ncbi:hypothetical protein Y032_0245g3567 [Ancylostoma ceylanicum]|uniref:Uncharacterized protein n=1 Tax=Ancylostoma ceylanicum TaxID=53326 RepID=A0A016SE11_9BILA|nr:hypothetical protein Y032_0245g3567 [Ancylostoma ceylanicum]
MWRVIIASRAEFASYSDHHFPSSQEKLPQEAAFPKIYFERQNHRRRPCINQLPSLDRSTDQFNLDIVVFNWVTAQHTYW